MAKVFGRSYTKKQLLDRVGDISQLIHARQATMRDGFSNGTDVVEITNSSGLQFSLLPGRALDISSASYKGHSLCFRASPGDVNPAFYEPEGFGWLRGWYGGLLTSCGMTFVGHPEIDQKIENELLPLHGRLSYIPGRNISLDSKWLEDDFELSVSGKMRESIVFGPNLELTRKISTRLGEKCIRITDSIENLSVNPSPLMFVYHCNPGFPILDAGSRFVIHTDLSTEWLEDQPVTVDEYNIVSSPRSREKDDVFVHRPLVDKSGNVHVALINDRIELGIYWTFQKTEMPLLNQWLHYHKGTYVAGIEPGNVSVLGREWNRTNGYLENIAPGEIRKFNLEIGVLEGSEEIRRFERKVAKNLIHKK